MKNILYFFLVTASLVLIGTYIFRNKKSKTDKPITTIAIKQNLVNIGDVEVNTPVNAQYIIYNKGTKDLLIEDVKTDCFCTTSKISKKIIAPEDSAEIVLSYDSTRVGPFQGSATILSNTEERSNVIVMRGNVLEI